MNAKKFYKIIVIAFVIFLAIALGYCVATWNIKALEWVMFTVFIACLGIGFDAFSKAGVIK